MEKAFTQYTVIREYENKFDQEELVRRMIRRHLQNKTELNNEEKERGGCGVKNDDE